MLRKMREDKNAFADLLCDINSDFTIGSKFKVNISYDQSVWNDDRLSDALDGKFWVNAKYINANKKISKKFSEITSSHGGVFIWVVKPHRLPIPGYSFIAYVGKSEENLQASINSFIKNSTDKYKGQVTKKELFDKCAMDLYLNYFECDDVKESKSIASQLIEIVGPPIKDTMIELQPREEAFA